jgi:methionyl-tRNA formyltransferase
MSSKIKTVFMGTPKFAVPFFKKLSQLDYLDVVAVITQPDKEVGRKKTITPPEIKTTAEELNIKVLQPKSIRDETFLVELSEIKPDLIFVVAYGKILPKKILDLPRFGCINIHGSLLPKYRGASPIQSVILSGEKETGIAIMKMDEGMDTGDVIYQESLKIEKNETYETLSDRLSAFGAEIMPKYLKKYLNGEITPTKQDSSKATSCKTINKEDGLIDFNKSATEIERMLRAYTPWPGIYLQNQGKKTQIIELEAVENQPDLTKQQGEFYVIDRKLYLNCFNSAINIIKLKPEGKNEMSARDFINGYL